MTEQKKPEVLIAGAGPVGMFAALVLARCGVRVRIVDEAPRRGAHSYGLALHAQSLALLREAGLLRAVMRNALGVGSVAIYDGAERRATLRLDEIRDDFPFLAVMRQDDFEGLLEHALREAGVEVGWNHYVAEIEQTLEGVTARVDRLEEVPMAVPVKYLETVITSSERVEVPFLIGAGGANSLVRKALDIPMIMAAPPQYFAVFEFETDMPIQDAVRVVLHNGLTSVLWPLPGGRCRWSFEITPEEAVIGPREKEHEGVEDGRPDFAVVTEDHLRAFLAERAPWFDGSIEEIRWRTVVRFERRLAERFGEGRVWLAGDAAHMTGPVGVQSMNAGLLEARDLGTVLARILSGLGTMSQLTEYERRHLARWRMMLGLDGEVSPILSCLPATGPDLLALLERVDSEELGTENWRSAGAIW
ncbi:MAG TPA: NAD(P)/FAD-dependent oxidoreductase [Rhodothermales bacterium]